MTEILKSMIFGVSAAAFFGGIAMTLVHTGALKETVRLGAGIMVLLALLYPVSKIRVSFLSRWEHQNTDAITQQVEQAQKQQRAAIEQTVSQEIQSYFTRKAKEHGIFRWEHQNTDAITQQVEQAQKQQRAAIEQTVSQEIQSYFTRKAKEHGILCDIEIHTTVEEDQTVSIQNAVVHGTLTEEEYRWVETMILAECELSQEDLRYVED